MEQRVVLVAVFLVAVSAVSGFVLLQEPTETAEEPEMNDSSEETGTQPAPCEEIEISIDSVSEGSAMVRQTNGDPVGNITATWALNSGEEVEVEESLTVRGRVNFLQSGVSGTVDSFSVSPVRCQNRTFEVEP